MIISFRITFAGQTLPSPAEEAYNQGAKESSVVAMFNVLQERTHPGEMRDSAKQMKWQSNVKGSA
jgi:hypothetical protein